MANEPGRVISSADRSLWATLLVLCWSAGCATSHVPEGGFLADTSKLRENDLSQGMYVQIEKSLGSYQAFVLEPLVVHFTPRQPLPVALRDAQAAGEAYHQAVTRALTDSRPLRAVETPGRGTLLVRGAVTDRFQRDEKEPGPGPATLELEAVDALTHKRVFAMIDPELAQRDAGGEFTEPQPAFNRFARRLQMRLEEAQFSAQKK